MCLCYVLKVLCVYLILEADHLGISFNIHGYWAAFNTYFKGWSRQLLQSIEDQIIVLYVPCCYTEPVTFLSTSPHIHINPSSDMIPLLREIDKETGRRLGKNEIRTEDRRNEAKGESGGWFPWALPQSSSTSAGALNGWRLHTKPPSGSQCVHVPVSAPPVLNIFSQFANVAQVLQPDPQPAPAPFLYTRFTFLWGRWVCVCGRVGG